MPRNAIIPPALQAVHDQWHFAPAVRAGQLVFCSGIIGTSRDGARPVSGLEGAQATTAKADAPLDALVAVRDPADQFATAFEALQAILAAAGSDLAHVVELTTYHVEMARHMATFMEVRAQFLAPPYPAWTAVEVAGLIVPGGLVELRAVATLPADDVAR